MVRARLVVAAAFGVLMMGGVARAAPVQWTAAMGGNDHWYELVAAEGITWTAARPAAQALGSGWDLATIGSAAEGAFVTSQLNAALPQRSHFWLGATDLDDEGVWKWVDGTPVTFAPWGAGEPNNGSGAENFLAYDLRGDVWYFNDAPDLLGQQYGFARGFIAERTPSAVAEPLSAVLLLVGLATVRRTRRR